MSEILVDTGAFYALLMVEDPDHATADALFQRATDERWRLMTTNAIVFETHALLLNRARNRRVVAEAFLRELASRKICVERLTEQDEGQAIDLFWAHQDKTYSLCDASSFVVMERLGIGRAMALDADFRSYGKFQILPEDGAKWPRMVREETREPYSAVPAGEAVAAAPLLPAERCSTSIPTK